VKAYPEKLHEILIGAVYRLIDYQDLLYSQTLFESFDKVYKIDKSVGNSSFFTSENFAENLALLMTYEDGIRMAELKTNSLRFTRIKKDNKQTSF